MTDRILISGGIVLTQDPDLGELPKADVLIEDDKIAAIGKHLPETMLVIDAAGDIVIPGFIDTHRHTWETCIRTCAPDFALITYFSAILDKFAPHYRAEDVHSATQWGALECINAGITTLVDWAHIMNTPDHADASVSALQATGIRSVFAYGFPNTSLVDWWFGPDYTGSVLTSDGDEARRLRSHFTSDDDRITMGLATRGPGFCKPDVVRHDWELAKELGINITVHVAMDRFGYTKGQITALRDMDLLYPGTTYVHASHFSDEEWQLVSDSGGNVSFAPQIEIQMGHGWAPAVTAVEYDVPIGLVRRRDDGISRPVHPDARSLRVRARTQAPGGMGRRPGWPGGITRSHHRGGALMGHDRWSRGGRDLRSDRFAHTGEEGGRRHHRRVGGECGADYRPGRRGRLRGGHLQREDRPRGRRDTQGRLQARGVARCAAQAVEASRDYLLEMFGDPEPGWLPPVLGD